MANACVTTNIRLGLTSMARNFQRDASSLLPFAIGNSGTPIVYRPQRLHNRVAGFMGDAAHVTAGQQPEIPDKLYFRIGDVSRLADVKPYVLRYWESEFPALSPKKSGTNQRLYRRKDVEMVLEIKSLLYDKRFTIEGAKKYFLGKPKKPAPMPVKRVVQGDLFQSAPLLNIELADQIRKELKDLLRLLK
jgi:DNA-binding transcriptional MerR regulator